MVFCSYVFTDTQIYQKTEEGHVYMCTKMGKEQWEQPILVARSVYNGHRLEFLVHEKDYSQFYYSLKHVL